MGIPRPRAPPISSSLLGPGPASSHFSVFLSQAPQWKGIIQVGFASVPIPLTPASSPASVKSRPLTTLPWPNNPFLPSE